MKLLLDQGLPRFSAQLLRNSEIDALHTGECGLARSSDRQIIDFAKAQGRIVVSLDSDFHALLALSRARSPSVVRIRMEGLTAEEVVSIIQKVLAQCSEDLAAGCAVSVQEGRIRIRRLPIEL